jgi:hypothetical protein
MYFGLNLVVCYQERVPPRAVFIYASTGVQVSLLFVDTTVQIPVYLGKCTELVTPRGLDCRMFNV